MIHYNMSKFVGFYTQVDHLNVSGTNMEDMLEKALLYKFKASKNQDILFMHFWWLLEDAPEWADGLKPMQGEPCPPSVRHLIRNQRHRYILSTWRAREVVVVRRLEVLGRTFKCPTGNHIAPNE